MQYTPKKKKKNTFLVSLYTVHTVNVFLSHSLIQRNQKFQIKQQKKTIAKINTK